MSMDLGWSFLPTTVTEYLLRRLIITLLWRHNGANASQITSLTVVCLTVYSGADQRKHISSASLAFVRGIHRRPVNSPHKWPVTRKMFPFDDVKMRVKGQGHWPAVCCHTVHDISPFSPFSNGLTSPGLCLIHLGYTPLGYRVLFSKLATRKLINLI